MSYVISSVSEMLGSWGNIVGCCWAKRSLRCNFCLAFNQSKVTYRYSYSGRFF